MTFDTEFIIIQYWAYPPIFQTVLKCLWLCSLAKGLSDSLIAAYKIMALLFTPPVQYWSKKKTIFLSTVHFSCKVVKVHDSNPQYHSNLTHNAPIATKVVCFSHLLKCLRSLYGKQCRPISDCSYRSSLFWVHAVCFYT